MSNRQSGKMVDQVGRWADHIGRTIGHILGTLAAHVQYIWSLDWMRMAVDLLVGAAATFFGLSAPQEEYIFVIRLRRHGPAQGEQLDTT